MPKRDGQADYQWNQKGGENVIAILTSNAEVVYVSDHSVDQTKTGAWKERFFSAAQRGMAPGGGNKFKRNRN